MMLTGARFQKVISFTPLEIARRPLHEPIHVTGAMLVVKGWLSGIIDLEKSSSSSIWSW